VVLGADCGGPGCGSRGSDQPALAVRTARRRSDAIWLRRPLSRPCRTRPTHSTLPHSAAP